MVATTSASRVWHFLAAGTSACTRGSVLYVQVQCLSHWMTGKDHHSANSRWPGAAWVPLKCIMRQANESKLHLLVCDILVCIAIGTMVNAPLCNSPHLQLFLSFYAIPTSLLFLWTIFLLFLVYGALTRKIAANLTHATARAK